MIIACFKKIHNTITEVKDNLGKKKGFDVGIVESLLQNNYNDDISFLLESVFSVLICPRCNKHFHNCEFGDAFIETTKYTRGIIINDYTFNVSFRVVICSECGRNHAIIPDCVIPYSRMTLDDAVCILKFEFMNNNDNTTPCLAVDPYYDKTVTLFDSYFDNYRSSFDLTADKSVIDLLDLLLVNPTAFIREFFYKCKKLFLVNRRMLDPNNISENEKKVTAIYLDSENLLI